MKDNVTFKVLIVVCLTSISLDIINGTTSIFPQAPLCRFYKGNFGSLASAIYLKNLLDYSLSDKLPRRISNSQKSITFSEFSEDSLSNQLLIIVESFGYINNSTIRNKFQGSINRLFTNKGWKLRWGNTNFNGGTTNAELRELINVEGDYQFFLNRENASKFVSIFNIKKRQGYRSSAIHSYVGNMFQREIWWENIGVDNHFFLGDVQTAFSFKNTLNYDSPFVSLNDEDSFDFIMKNTDNHAKKFVYLLTENAHLPFKGDPKKPLISRNFDIDKFKELSTEAKGQHKQISNFLGYLANQLDKKRFQKILIIGDHMPPFVKKEDRNFYSNKLVPYCVLTLIN